MDISKFFNQKYTMLIKRKEKSGFQNIDKILSIWLIKKIEKFCKNEYIKFVNKYKYISIINY